ncbi:hypothetical protein [Chitinimonas naiadis]
MNCNTLEALRRILEDAPDTPFVEVSHALYATLIDADLLDHDPRGGVGPVLRDTRIEILLAGESPDQNPLATPGSLPSFPVHIVYAPRSLAAVCLMEAARAVVAIRYGYAPDQIGVEGMYGQYRGNTRLQHERAHRRDIACATLAVALYWQQHHGLYNARDERLERDFLRAEVLNAGAGREQEIFWEGDEMLQYFSPLVRDTIFISHAEKMSEHFAERMPMVQALTRALWRTQTPLQLPQMDKQAIIAAVRPLLAQDHPLLRDSELDLFDLWESLPVPVASEVAQVQPGSHTELAPIMPLISQAAPKPAKADDAADSGLISRLRTVFRR